MEQTKRRRRGWRYALNLTAFFVVAMIVVGSGMSIVFGLQDTNNLLHPRGEICAETAQSTRLPLEAVAFTTTDGLALRGWYLPSQNGAAVIALHGRGGSRCGMLDISRVLAAHGYGVLLFDLRAHGDSDGDLYDRGWRDGIAAADFLRSKKGIEGRRIGAIGFSLGANVAIQAAARRTEPAHIRWMICPVGIRYWTG